jgi:recombination protein RecA
MMTKEGISVVDGSEEDKPIGIRIQVTNRKNKLATPFLKSSIVVRFGQGIDNLESVIDVSLNKKLIKKTGAWFGFADEIKIVEDDEFFGDTGTIQGREKVHAYLLKHESVLNQLTNKLVEKEIPAKEEDEAGVEEVVENLDEATEAALAEAAAKASSKRAKKKKEEVPIVAKEEELA